MFRWLMRVYRQLDGELKYGLKRADITLSCKPGCSYCCYMITAVNVFEGMLLAREVLKTKGWVNIAKACREIVLKEEETGYNRGAYFQKRIPCPLLNTDTKLCQFYAARPAACRLHAATSDPILCSQENREGVIIALNTAYLQAKFSRLTLEASKVNAVVCPLPLMLLFCMGLRATNSEQRTQLLELTKGLPNPSEWLEKFDSNEVNETWKREYFGETQKIYEEAYSRAFGLDSTNEKQLTG